MRTRGRAGGSGSESRFSTHSQEGEHDRQLELGKQQGDHKQRYDCSCRHCYHYSDQDFHLGLVGHIARSKAVRITLQLLCRSCNRIKGDRGMEYLRVKLQL